MVQLSICVIGLKKAGKKSFIQSLLIDHLSKFNERSKKHVIFNITTDRTVSRKIKISNASIYFYIVDINTGFTQKDIKNLYDISSLIQRKGGNFAVVANKLDARFISYRPIREDIIDGTFYPQIWFLDNNHKKLFQDVHSVIIKLNKNINICSYPRKIFIYPYSVKMASLDFSAQLYQPAIEALHNEILDTLSHMPEIIEDHNSCCFSQKSNVLSVNTPLLKKN